MPQSRTIGWADGSRVHGGHVLQAGGRHLHGGEFLVDGVDVVAGVGVVDIAGGGDTAAPPVG
ncbi:hypothetical protein [Streptomyces sp. NEAU-NA10]|uniref:hypothetical protein n=1 Tax=Streptomyces sp. NEAU-NA10 TaxID=3416050 RepID=UPI003CC542A0